MSRIISDYEQRQQAISANASFIVRAPAGSGKTELLIQRYLGLLSQVDAPEEIVAITFTRKAAAEMQSRILGALQRAATGPEPETDHARQTWLLARAALKRDHALDWQLQQSPARLRVMTIDSLCAALTRHMPVLSGLGTQPETLEDAGELYEQAAINTLALLNSGENWADSIARLLEHIDNDLPRLKQLIMAMLGKRDQWLRHVATDHQREDLEAALQHVITEQLHLVEKLMPARCVQPLCELATFAADNLADNKPEHPTVRCQDMAHLPGHGIADFPRWSGLCEMLLKADGDWRQRVDARNGFPPAGKGAGAETRAAMKTRLTGLIEQLRDVHGLLPALQEIRLLPPPQYSDDDWEVVGALCQVLVLAEGQLRLIFAANNQMDFTGISHAAIAALGNDEAPTDLALTLDYRIRHLMVDEYQDISVNQSELLQRLTAGWSAGDGHTLFLVGDPMQSIYRFREAEVGIFINTWESRRLGQVPLEPVAIHTNFRSQPGVVDWVNRTFRTVMPELEDITTGAVTYEESTAFHNVQSIRSVNVYPAFDNDAGVEAGEIVGRIRDLQTSDPLGSIAVLVRSRSHLARIIPALRNAGLSFQAVDIQGLMTRPEIQDLLALIRALCHRADRIAWLALLRGPWCGLTLGDLLPLSPDEERLTIWDAINDEVRTRMLSKDGRQRLQRFRDIMAVVMSDVHRQPLHHVVESAWLRLGGPALMKNSAACGNVLTVLDCLREVGQGGRLPDLTRFLQKVAALFSAPEYAAESRIQLMTIHKAKGLEFDHVLVPELGRKTRPNSVELLQWLLLPRSNQSRDLILAPIRAAGSRQAPVYDYVSAIEKRKQENEDIRLLYVATTRAKKSLHLFGHAGVKEEDGAITCKPVSGSFLHYLWPVLADDYNKALAQYQPHNVTDDAIPVDPLWRRLPRNPELPVPEPLAREHPEMSPDEIRDDIEFEWAGETIKHIGAVVHRCIQQIGRDGLDNWDESRIEAARPWYESRLRQLGVGERELPAAVSDVIRALTGMLNDERGRWILDNNHRDHQDELALTGVYEQRVINVRIDRTFIDAEGVRWIIDYKTSRHGEPDIEPFLDREQDRYRTQLERYAHIFTAMEDRPVRLALYFPLLQGWRCWDAPS